MLPIKAEAKAYSIIALYDIFVFSVKKIKTKGFTFCKVIKVEKIGHVAPSATAGSH